MQVTHPQHSEKSISLHIASNLKSLPKLTNNEIIEGRVLKAYPSGQFLISIKGKNVMAISNVPLKRGSVLTLKVEKISSVPVLKILGDGKRDIKAFNIPLILSAIKENLWESLLDSLNSKAVPRGKASLLKGLMNHVTMEIFSEPSQEILRTLIDKSGFRWEWKLKKAALQKNISGADIEKLVETDLKGMASKFFSLDGEKDILLKKLLSTISNIQLLNQQGFERERKIFLPIPIQLPDGLFTVGQLLIYMPKKREDGHAKQKNHDKSFIITFLLTMSKLGPLRADLSMKGNEIGGNFIVTSEKSKQIIENNLPAFVGSIKGKGFTVSAMECHLRDAEEVKKSPIREIFYEEGNTISLIA
jgi:hypothetical protein